MSENLKRVATSRRPAVPRIACVICALFLAAIGVSSALAEGESSFVLEIALSQNAITPGGATWKAGAPVFFIITMKNNSEHVLHFALTNPAFNYRAIVLDSKGNAVPETEVFRKMRESLRSPFGITTRNILVELKPHETCQDTIEISYLYDVVEPGEYTVQLERDLPPELGKGVVKSNTIAVTVVAGSSPSQQMTIKDPAEYDAYVKVVQTPNPTERVQAVERFLRQYPNSVVKAEALKLLMMAYQQLKNEDEAVRTAERLLECEPANLRALALVAYTYHECAARNGSDARKCSDNAAKYGHQGLEVLRKEQEPPDGMTDDEFKTLKTQVRPILEEAARLERSKDKNAQQHSAH
ncbi:MAG: hypothetical protein LAN70_00455 [Acidobacteriia bacterium]|nr:hypothetical protein [Terriglobia bacterium]